MADTLDIQQPQPFDLVDHTLLISGNAVSFEGTLTIKVGEGHDEYSSFTQVGGLALRQFQGSISIPERQRIQIESPFSDAR